MSEIVQLEDLEVCEQRLRASLRDLGRVVVAYSGGVDSALVADVAWSELGDSMCALIADSPSLDRGELEAARALAKERGFPLVVVETQEMADERYLQNDLKRCYFCKSELFDCARAFAASHDFDVVADGFNADDRGDYRPGKAAGDERGVRSPLADAGLGKDAVRALARQRGLSVWDKPAAPCLSSRLPYGERVTPQKLAQVAAAERVLHDLGFRICRVRHHGDVARIEVPATEVARFAEEELRARVLEGIREAGYRFVALDLAGFRSGNLNP